MGKEDADAKTKPPSWPRAKQGSKPTNGGSITHLSSKVAEMLNLANSVTPLAYIFAVSQIRTEN